LTTPTTPTPWFCVQSGACSFSLLGSRITADPTANEYDRFCGDFPEQSDSDVLTINDVSCGNGIRADGASVRMWQRSWGA